VETEEEGTGFTIKEKQTILRSLLSETSVLLLSSFLFVFGVFVNNTLSFTVIVGAVQAVCHPLQIKREVSVFCRSPDEMCELIIVYIPTFSCLPLQGPLL